MSCQPASATIPTGIQLSRPPWAPVITEGPQAAFQGCNIGIEVTVATYRNRNEKENSVRKITGLNKSTDVTLKRGGLSCSL